MLVHIFILFIPNIFSRIYKLLTILLIIILIHIFCFMYVGYSDFSMTILGRLVMTYHRATNDVDKFKSKFISNEQSTDLKPSQTEVSIEKSTHNETIENIEKLSREEYRTQRFNGPYSKTMLGPRGTIYYDSIEKIKKSPILGSPKGIGGISHHCTLLDVTVGTGIFGGLLYLMIVFCGFRDALLAIRKTPEFGWLGIIFIMNIFCSVLNGGAIEYEYIWWFALIALRANAYMYNSHPTGSKIATIGN
jgi:hypothetical protein